MILKTKKEVTFNKPVSGTETAILIGISPDCIRKGESYFALNYTLSLENGAPIMQNALELKSKEEIIALNDAIKSDLPVYESTPEPEFEELKKFLLFRIEMHRMLVVMNPKLKVEDIEILPIEVNYKD